MFSIKIFARPLVKIDHVIFIYVTTPHSESAVLAITHERALLQMASRFAQVGEEEIPHIISDSIPTSTKRQTAWSDSIFKGKSATKQLKFCLCFSVKLICRLRKTGDSEKSGFLRRKLLKKNLKKLNEFVVKLQFFFSLLSRMAATEITV